MSLVKVFNVTNKEVTQEFEETFREHAPMIYRTAYSVTRTPEDGRRILAVAQSTITDDRGNYRLFWLTSGRYVVIAAPRNSAGPPPPSHPPIRPGDVTRTTGDILLAPGSLAIALFDTFTGGLDGTNFVKHLLEDGSVQEESWMPTFYPATADRTQAVPLDVTPGSTVTGIDISLGPSPVQKIRGRVTGFTGLATVVLSSASQGTIGPLPQAPASVDGVVFDSETKQPLAGATVMAQDRSGSAARLTTVTGSDGRFAFRSIAPGTYMIEASRAGYVSEAAGSPVVDARNFSPNPLVAATLPKLLELTSGQVLTGLRFTLTPGGVISGRLTNEYGDVVAGAVVQVLKTTHENGLRERTLVQSVVSNDLGEYRFFMLKPGQYYVSLVPPALVIQNVTNQSFSIPLFYPGTIDAKAATVLDLHVGETIDGVSFPSIPTRNRRIAGGVQGNGSDGLTVILSPANGTAKKTVNIGRSDPNPSFQFSDIVPGTYNLVAHTHDMRSALQLDVRNADVLGTRILLSPCFRIPSRARIEGRPPGDDPTLGNITFSVRPDIPVPGLEPERYSPFANGRFALGVLRRDYWIDITQSEDYYIKSITLDGFDVLNQGLQVTSSVEGPMEIVIDTHFGEVQGSVAQPNVTVVLVPDAARRNQRPLYQSSKLSTGAFYFEKVPPGDYKLFAWSEDTIDNGGPWLDPEYLRQHEDRATPIRIQVDRKTILDRPIPVF